MDTNLKTINPIEEVTKPPLEDCIGLERIRRMQHSTLATGPWRVVKIWLRSLRVERVRRGVRTSDRGGLVSAVPVLEVMEQGSVWSPCHRQCLEQVGDYAPWGQLDRGGG
jgi:hypothetical protein